MKKIFLIAAVYLLCVSCGVKDNPEYKSQISYNKAIQLV